MQAFSNILDDHGRPLRQDIISEIAPEVPEQGKYKIPDKGPDPMKYYRAISGLLKFLTHFEIMKELTVGFQVVFLL